MKNLKIEVSTDDAMRIVSDESVSVNLRAQMYAFIYRQKLEAMNNEQLRAEFESVYDQEIIVDLFFMHGLRGTPITREGLIDLLADIAFDVYENGDEKALIGALSSSNTL